MDADAFRLLRVGARFSKKAADVGGAPLIPSIRQLSSSATAGEQTKPAGDGAQKSVTKKKVKIHTAGDEIPPVIDDFDELRTHEQFPAPQFLMHSIEKMGLREPTPIQTQAIPLMLQGRHLFAIAPTGSGKTAAFMIPILMRLANTQPPAVSAVPHASVGASATAAAAASTTPAAGGRSVRAVVLSPTRELAQQLHRVAERLAEGSHLHVLLLTKHSRATVRNPAVPCDVLVATPLLLARMVQDGEVSLANTECVVLDEADRLFELGLLDPVDRVVAAVPRSALLALFSATLPPAVEDTARTVLRDPVRVVVGSRHATAGNVQQRLVYCGSEEGKLLAMRDLLRGGLQPPVMVFVQTVERARQLYDELAPGHPFVGVVHSDLPPDEREQTVRRFRRGELWVLIATDLLGRGMDFKGLQTVVNYDFPPSTVAYIHRVGRTGRAGRPGAAITLFTDADTELLRPVATLVREAGGDVPDWMLALRRPSKQRRRELARHPVRRDPVGAPARSTDPGAWRLRAGGKRHPHQAAAEEEEEEVVHVGAKRRAQQPDEEAENGQRAGDGASDSSGVESDERPSAAPRRASRRHNVHRHRRRARDGSGAD